MDAVVGDAVLRKVVGPDLLRSISGAHLRAPLARPRGFLLRHHAIEEARAQDLERLDLVLELRFLILALYFEPGRQMGDADRAVGRVDALAAGAAGAEH